MSWAARLRSTVKCVLIVLAVLLSLLLVHQWILPILAFLIPNLSSTVFDLGVYGAYPTQLFRSAGIKGPQVSRMLWDKRCDHGHVLLTPNGPSVDQPGPMMLDARGELVWTSKDFGSTANLKVQTYKGVDYLTVWSGEKAATSGKGVYFMIDSSYQVARIITAVGDDLYGDLHEFKITESGTALLTVYNTTTADLRGMGHGRGANGWIVDNLVQEIDLETGELLFQWRASDHFDPVDTYMTNPFGGYWESIPFDYYHLNSIEKDSEGNYIISSRHFHSVTCISPSGDILWILGGRDNQFQDLSDGQATNFKWQHDARWHDEEKQILSLFDNQKAGALHVDATSSRAMFIQLDVPNRTAKLIQSLESLQGILASSQGSVQVLLESDQTFVGWGSAAAYSEFTSSGALLCETHLGASWFFWLERFKSYRASKVFGWRGEPQDPPEVKIEDDSLYVSWNGATEVAYWALEVEREKTRPDDHGFWSPETPNEELRSRKFEEIDVIPKTGFEGMFDLESSDEHITKYRVAALDKDHILLRYSDPIEYGADAGTSSAWSILFKICLVTGILAGIRLTFKWYRSGQTLQSWSNSQHPAWKNWRPTSSHWRQMRRAAALDWVQMQLTRARRPR